MRIISAVTPHHSSTMTIPGVDSASFSGTARYPGAVFPSGRVNSIIRPMKPNLPSHTCFKGSGFSAYRRLAGDEPLIRGFDLLGRRTLAQPFQNRVVGRVRFDCRVERFGRDSPALHDALVHRTGINVVVNRAVGESACFVEHAR